MTVPKLIYKLVNAKLYEQLEGDKFLGKREMSKSEHELLEISVKKIKIGNKEEIPEAYVSSFYDFLRENKIRPLSRYDKEFRFLKNRKDSRLTNIPEEFQKELLEKYIVGEKTRMEKESEERQLEMKKDLRVLIKLYQKQSQFKNNYNLFKKKYRKEPKFKRASKYFDPAIIFKEVIEEKTSSNFSKHTKSTIDDFLKLLSTLTIKKNTTFKDLLYERVVCEFKLDMNNKKRIFKEFKDQFVKS